MSELLWNDEQDCPLQHLRVIDLTVMLPGPYLTRLLAQYGADVIKVEALPKGDPTREFEGSHFFELLNAGKRSIAVNLKAPEGVQIIKRLVGEADLFVESFKDGVMDRMGLGYPELSEENPDVIYFSLRGFAGKYSGVAGHDLNFIATSGCGEWYLESGNPNYSTQFSDMIGGVFVPAMKLLFHLANPLRRGMHLISSIDDSFRSLYLPRAYAQLKNESIPKDAKLNVNTTTLGTFPHSRYYKCRDGQWVSLNAIQSKHWETFCEVVDRTPWKSRMYDSTLVPEVETLFKDAPATYWEALSSKREICLFRVIPWQEHLQYSQARQQLHSDPLTWAGFTPNPSLLPPPTFGRDTYAVMTSLGATNKEISGWFDKGVIYQPSGSKTP